MTYPTLLVNLEAGRPNTHLLEAAKDLAARFHSAIIGSTACTPIQLLYGDGYAYGDVLEQDGKEIAKEIEATKAEFHAALAHHPHPAEWRDAVLITSLATHLASEAGAADLVLTTAATATSVNAARQVDTGDLVMQSGRPILLVAPTPFRTARIMVACKDTAEARRAIADALPLLKRASHVALVEVAPDDDLPAARTRLATIARWLARHGITADLHAIPSTHDDPATLAAAADHHHADIVVAGAYGHSRVREWALGGVTRSLLQTPTRHALISH